MPARTTIKDSLRLCPRMGDMRRRGGGMDVGGRERGAGW